MAWTEAHGGYWVVSDYTGVFEAARDDSTCSPRVAASTAAPASTTSSPRRRSACTSPSSSTRPSTAPTARSSTRSPRRRRSERMQPMIEQWTTAFIDDVIENGDLRPRVRDRRAGDRHDRLARTRRRRLAALLTGPALGAGRPGRAARSTRTPSRSTSPGWSSTIAEAIAERRREPRDDVIIDPPRGRRSTAQPITDDDVYSMVELLISGGVGTTASLVIADPGPPLRAPRPADSSGRAPRAARPGRRGVPPRLLADPGAGPHRHSRRRLPWLPDAGGRPRPARVGVREPRPRPVRDVPTRSTSTAGRTGTPPSAWASIAAPARTSVARWPAS